MDHSNRALFGVKCGAVVTARWVSLLNYSFSSDYQIWHLILRVGREGGQIGSIRQSPRKTRVLLRPERGIAIATSADKTLLLVFEQYGITSHI